MPSEVLGARNAMSSFLCQQNIETPHIQVVYYKYFPISFKNMYFNVLLYCFRWRGITQCILQIWNALGADNRGLQVHLGKLRRTVWFCPQGQLVCVTFYRWINWYFFMISGWWRLLHFRGPFARVSRSFFSFRKTVFRPSVPQVGFWNVYERRFWVYSQPREPQRCLQ